MWTPIILKCWPCFLLAIYSNFVRYNLLHVVSVDLILSKIFGETAKISTAQIQFGEKFVRWSFRSAKILLQIFVRRKFLWWKFLLRKLLAPTVHPKTLRPQSIYYNILPTTFEIVTKPLKCEVPYTIIMQFFSIIPLLTKSKAFLKSRNTHTKY